MRHRVVLFTLLLALFCAPSVLLAQAAPAQAPPPPGMTTTVVDEGFNQYVSGYFNFNTGGNLFQDRTDGTPIGYGGALTFWGRGKFSAEVDFNYNPNFFDKSGDLGDNNLLTLTFGGIIGPWINQGGQVRFRPYAAFGGGLMRSSISEFATVGWATSKNLGIVDAGGGLLVFFHPRVGVRGDVRYRWGVGANNDSDGWGLIDNWTYLRASVGIALAF